jgi:hypothetical protein
LQRDGSSVATLSAKRLSHWFNHDNQFGLLVGITSGLFINYVLRTELCAQDPPYSMGFYRLEESDNLRVLHGRQAVGFGPSYVIDDRGYGDNGCRDGFSGDAKGGGQGVARPKRDGGRFAFQHRRDWPSWEGKNLTAVLL